MPCDNHEIARVLNETADLLEIAGENFFRVRAYRNAALAVADHPAPLAPLDRKQLAEIPGIGADLAGKIRTLIEGGQIDTHQALLKRVPVGLLELRHIRGLGPKRIKTLFDVLKVKGQDDLRKAAEAGALGDLPGFGPRMEAQIRE